MSFQENLFGTDMRTEKEIISDRYRDFVTEFLEEHEIHVLYPKVLKDKLFFPTLKNLFVSHVVKGAWDEELFADSVFAAIKKGKKLSNITIGQEAGIIKSKGED